MRAGWLVAGALILPAIAFSRGPQRPAAPVRAQAQAAAVAAPGPQEHLEVPPPPFSEGVFPCTFCHDNKDLKPNRKRRPLPDDHNDIVLKHDEKNRWCLDCHDADNRDVLHLASGEHLPFEESYRLCGQCHGEKYRDWRVGVHGRRTGEWNGQKGYLLCVNCHSPHQPHFKPMAPSRAPARPTRPK